VQSPDVDIQGSSTEPVPLVVDFDNPHRGAGVPLQGDYPSGVIDWPENEWKVCAPGGRMSTFSLCATDPKAAKAHFRFVSPRILLRADVYNPTNHEVSLTIRAPEMREVTFRLKPDQLQRIKTGWVDRASMVTFESDGLSELRFDNLAYSPYLWSSVYRAE
jgi:hypothetical protein